MLPKCPLDPKQRSAPLRELHPIPSNRDFDAFFATRRNAGGTGTGLATVRAVMMSHGQIRMSHGDSAFAERRKRVL
ncbi:MAG: hypothetical protein HY852_23365 [Bradyrhizobium sp.]|uniref:hypothetical protein n=1 Tax=Bradyrhizobium sp. TaxID=376 RepID=UPI00345C0480|nr:hypothetical protein [Bradyrhizobium sp.]